MPAPQAAKPTPLEVEQRSAILARGLGTQQITRRVALADLEKFSLKEASPTWGKLLFGIAAKQAFRNYKLAGDEPITASL